MSCKEKCNIEFERNQGLRVFPILIQERMIL